MVERMKDKDELRLEALFRSDHIADDGFSRRVMRRVRRRIWISRLALPTALLVGSLIAFRPASQLVAALLKLMDILPANLTAGLPAVAMPSVSAVPQLSTLIVGGALIAAALLFVRALED